MLAQQDLPGWLIDPPVEASAEIFDPKTNATVAAPAMATARFGSQAVALPSGDVLVSQGCESATVCDTSNDLFDAAAGVFKPFAPAVTKRAFHALLYDPKSHLVMANGGCEPSTCSWWSETFDLASMSPPIVDAGKRTPQPDAGKPGPIAATGGCGCEHAPVGAIGWPAIGALALVLRRVLRRRPSRGASA